MHRDTRADRLMCAAGNGATPLRSRPRGAGRRGASRGVCGVVKILVLAFVFLALSACGAPVVEIPVGDGALAYADVKAMYAEAKAYLTISCGQKKIDVDTCRRFAQLDVQMGVVDAMVRQTIRDSRAPVDWGQVMAIMGQVVGIAVKSGLGL